MDRTGTKAKRKGMKHIWISVFIGVVINVGLYFVMTLIGLLREDVDWALRGSGMPIEVRRELEELQEVLMKIQDCIE